MEFQNAEFKAAYGTFSQLPKSDRIEIAFAGRSNVGKSSLINRVFGRRALARVSSVPGKHRPSTFTVLKTSILLTFRAMAMLKSRNPRKSAGGSLSAGISPTRIGISHLFSH